MLRFNTLDRSEPPVRFLSVTSKGSAHSGPNSTLPESVNRFRNPTIRRLLSMVVPIVSEVDVGLDEAVVEAVEGGREETVWLALGELLAEALGELSDALGELLAEALSDIDGDPEGSRQNASPIRKQTVVFRAARALWRMITSTHFVPVGSSAFSGFRTVSCRDISLQLPSYKTMSGSGSPGPSLSKRSAVTIALGGNAPGSSNTWPSTSCEGGRSGHDAIHPASVRLASMVEPSMTASAAYPAAWAGVKGPRVVAITARAVTTITRTTRAPRPSSARK